MPEGVETETVLPFFWLEIALPTGEFSDILFFLKSISDSPTSLYLYSCFVAVFWSVTVEPSETLSVERLESSTTSTALRIASSSSIRVSFSACSALASSYSEFSERSPCALASSIRAAISLLFLVLRSESSFWSSSKPSLVICFLMISSARLCLL